MTIRMNRFPVDGMLAVFLGRAYIALSLLRNRSDHGATTTLMGYRLYFVSEEFTARRTRPRHRYRQSFETTGSIVVYTTAFSQMKHHGFVLLGVLCCSFWTAWISVYVLTAYPGVSGWMPSSLSSTTRTASFIAEDRRPTRIQAASKGFGASSPSANVNKKALLKKVQQTYGGTTPEAIRTGTQRRMDAMRMELPDHMHRAASLYQQLCVWNATVARMSLYQQMQIPMREVEQKKEMQDELSRIYQEHHVSNTDLHNLFQKMTWDASADAKATRAVLSGSMSQHILQRIERACSVVTEAVLRNGPNGRCFDVGCGHGTLVPTFRNQLQDSQIYGLDLSSEMIRNARELYPLCHWEAGDLLQYPGPPVSSNEAPGFDGILFCSSLHDMPDCHAALTKAASLLRGPGCPLVLVHASGAGHVLQQVQANPVLVRRGLPTADELREWADDWQMQLTLEPASPNTPRDVAEGYLAVLEKML
jgi:2-polyprenyl-3-methyl-5-hydroxy-6-metoxy-1,4-benzoquinol methylase